MREAAEGGRLLARMLLPVFLATSPAGATAQPVQSARPAAPASAASASDRGPVGRIDGVSLEAPRSPTPSDRMGEVTAIGADWVAVIPYAFVRRGSGEVVFDQERQYWGERSEGIRVQVEQAREHGLRVMLKPHVWVRGRSGGADGSTGGSSWAGDYLPESPAEWRTWEAQYREYVLGAARLAAQLDVEILCVGTELSRIVDHRPGFFRDLIREVRRLYDGEVTYAANWDAYERTPFWDQLDYIGVDAYFPLSSDPDASVEDLVAAWDPVVRELSAFSRRHAKPLLFTEFGYRSVAGAAGEQWLLPAERRTDIALLDEQAQATAYEALFRTWWDRSDLTRFAGGFLWEWHLTESRAERADGAGAAADGTTGLTPRSSARATGYTPQGKAVEDVLREWWR